MKCALALTLYSEFMGKWRGRVWSKKCEIAWKNTPWFCSRCRNGNEHLLALLYSRFPLSPGQDAQTEVWTMRISTGHFPHLLCSWLSALSLFPEQKCFEKCYLDLVFWKGCLSFMWQLPYVEYFRQYRWPCRKVWVVSSINIFERISASIMQLDSYCSYNTPFGLLYYCFNHI